MANNGLLLINLGSPNSIHPSDVRKYLKEFLSDPRVIDINPLSRWLLLNLIILPFRTKKSAHAYSTIWTDKGSPLVQHTAELALKIQNKLGSSIKVNYAMRYQTPSINKAIDDFQRHGIDHITVLPLFPQYSSAANGSAVEAVFQHVKHQWNTSNIEILGEFYDHQGYINAFAENGKKILKDFTPERIIFSFHGLPERHCIKSDESGGKHCLQKDNCCETIIAANRRCYRAQCFKTAHELANALSIPQQSWEIAFQSRLGRTPWIKPYFDERIEILAQQGVKNIVVFSPSFVADCLETLEEIAIRAKRDFIDAGGNDLKLIPSLNANDLWVDGIIQILRERSKLPIKT
ncbi:MAG: ferrochelatase [Bdellovibrionota bacterium]